MTLSCNSGGSHEQIMALIQADLKAIGINVKTDLTEWAAYLPKLQDHQYQIGRMGWIADYPIIDNFLYPIFYSTSSNNYSGYADPAVDKAITDARQIADSDKRVKAYQEIVKTIGAGRSCHPDHGLPARSGHGCPGEQSHLQPDGSARLPELLDRTEVGVDNQERLAIEVPSGSAPHGARYRSLLSQESRTTRC